MGCVVSAMPPFVGEIFFDWEVHEWEQVEVAITLWGKGGDKMSCAPVFTVKKVGVSGGGDLLGGLQFTRMFFS